MAISKKDNKRPRKEKSGSIGLDALREKYGLGKLEGNEQSSRGGNVKYTPGSKPKNSGQKPAKGAGNASAAAEKILYNAEAPYNFVPLISEVVTGEIDEVSQTAYKEHVLAHGKNTGYIDLEITSKSPLFIGGNGEKFFAPSGKPMIPGSSIRGMVKNLFKIITCGSMRPGEDIEDKHLYSRGMAAKGNFGKYYSERMSETKTVTIDGKQVRKPFSKAQPGFLIKLKGTDEYYVCPAQGKKVKYEENDSRRSAKKGSVTWPVKKEDTDIYRCEIHTGKMTHKNKKNGIFEDKWIYYTIFSPDWKAESRLPVPAQVVRDYDNDHPANDKLKGISLRAMAKKDNEAAGFTHCKDIDFVVPCCYLAEDGVVQHFGHGLHYRIPYKKSIADHVSNSLKDESVADLSDMIFGRRELWGSRVFFEDALHEGTVKKLGSSLTHPLLSPKPTSFQLYLEQSPDADMNTLKHWDEEAKIRGYKLYWHQGNNENQWQLNPAKDKKIEGMKPIEPLSANNCFKGRIRFSNLSDVELGALLAVFDLARKDKNICYKLGMGKSIGLGSVTISAGLHLIDEKVRYGCMFDSDSISEGMSDGEQQWNSLMDAFEAYRTQHLKREKAFQKVMHELKTMLDWSVTKNQASWLPKMAYMPIGDKTDHRYRDRAILKKPSEYIQ
ncbi:MAG: TIGR03986 family CRISPR-associated RAMP protein [Anaerovibrio sp.]|uniref:TIGR03986 family type III CRISPR-associated RAMP protein n=1 Tax=Anaerovibrio sp. TaxID=1872532 RepID=UPI00263542A2|nr:TIGR03986 family CRISPR-associated RAMP protein [Anaerovibrio sp.]MDD7678764.1 TIGR03986 family CRISPR-associated RAMP protein [Anaerovibrio sp.]MDY2604088.1 TIGR03986 family CRISPR-associated RAMP protein [Anaerovibrio sp.]